MSDLKLIRINTGTLTLTTSFVDVFTFISVAAGKRARLSSADIIRGYIHLGLQRNGFSGAFIEVRTILNDGTNDHVLEHLRWSDAENTQETLTRDLLAAQSDNVPADADARFNFLSGFGLNRAIAHFYKSAATAGTRELLFTDRYDLTVPHDQRVVAPSPLVLGPGESYRVQIKKASPFTTATARFNFLANAVEESI